MRRLGLILLVAFLAGCLGSGHPAVPTQQPMAGDQSTQGTEAGVPEPAAASPARTDPRVEEFAGNLTFHQTAAVICPLYFEGPAESTALVLRFGNATTMDFTFDWIANVSMFQGALIGLTPEGTSIGGSEDSIRGPSVLVWHLGKDRLSVYGDQRVYLNIEGPSCNPDEPPAESGVDYDQVIHYVGNVTYSQ
jgi:hypothetical protein